MFAPRIAHFVPLFADWFLPIANRFSSALFVMATIHFAIMRTASAQSANGFELTPSNHSKPIVAQSEDATGIVLVSRLSDARAYAAGPGGDGNPPPQQQTDFLPAVLSNTAMSWGEPGTADSGCTSNSRIPANIQKGTLQIMGDGTAHASVGVPGGSGFNAGAAAKLIVISFTITDRSYEYLLTGQLSATGASGSPEYPNTATARLTTGEETVFEVIADHPGVTLAKNGVLQPNTYTFAVEVSAYARAPAATNSSNGNFVFLLRPVPISTASLSSSKQ